MNINTEKNFIFCITVAFQNIMANKGDNGKNIDGKPKIPCSLKGNGKIAAPNIEKEYVRINKIGIVCNPISIAVL